MKLNKCSYNHPCLKKTFPYIETTIEFKDEIFLQLISPPLFSSTSPSAFAVFHFSLSTPSFIISNKMKLNEILKELKGKKEVIKNEA